MSTKPWKTTARVWDRKTQSLVTIEIAIEIDWQAVADKLAYGANRNKSGKSGLLGGAITGKIVKPKTTTTKTRGEG